jgi:hypothetical protein
VFRMSVVNDCISNTSKYTSVELHVDTKHVLKHAHDKYLQGKYAVVWYLSNSHLEV